MYDCIVYGSSKPFANIWYDSRIIYIFFEDIGLMILSLMVEKTVKVGILKIQYAALLN